MTVVLEGVLRPHTRDDADGLFPHRPCLLGADLETVHLDQRGGASGAEVTPPVAEDVQHRGALGNPHRMVVLRRQQRHGVADADVLCALRNGAVQHLRRRAVRELLQKMVLNRPEMVEPHLIGKRHLLENLLVNVPFDSRVMGFGNLNLIHKPEFHGFILS